MQRPASIDWHDDNEAVHSAKHGIPFAFAARVFLDKNRLEIEDVRKAYDPRRFNTAGVVDSLCINVTFAMQGTTAWIISVRPASRRERKRYGQAHS